jgi:hypothetical protein
MITVDSFFTQGKSHKVCEDYANSIQSMPMISVSDGCSSSKHTDFGSRIISKALEMTLASPISAEFRESGGLEDSTFESIIMNKSVDIAYLMKMDTRCLDATLGFAFIRKNAIDVRFFGDGCIVTVDKDNNIKIVDIEYDKNAPYYLNYFFDEDRKKAYKELKQKKIIKYTTINATGSMQFNTVDSNEDFEWMSFDLATTRSVSIFTDGVKTFMPHSQTTPSMEFTKVIKELVNFPLPNGEFVNRKCLRFLKIHPEYYFFDDFSMATIYNGD